MTASNKLHPLEILDLAGFVGECWKSTLSPLPREEGGGSEEKKIRVKVSTLETQF